MKLRFTKAWVAAAITLSLAACSRTTDSATDSKAAPDAAAKADFPLSSKPASLIIAEGTPINVRTQTELSTKTVKTGDTFSATLAEPILVEGQVVAPRGARVEGRVVNSDPGGRVKGLAIISVRLTQLHVGSREVAINTGTVAHKAHATKRKDAAKVGIGAGIGAAIGAIAGGGQGAAIGAASGGAAGTGLVLATHGDPAVVPAESVLKFKLTAPVTVEPS
jgi:hypothetical protein